MKVTIKSIAQEAGVSIGTVDRVLHNRGGVNEETERRVLQIAEKLDYRPNSISKALALLRNPRVIAVLINAPEYNYFAAEIARGVAAAAEEMSDFGIDVVYHYMHSTLEAEQLRHLDEIKGENVSGVILKPVNYPSVQQKIDELVDVGIPVITCTSDTSNSKRTAFVGHDHRKEGRMLARLLGMTLRPNACIAILVGSMNVLGHQRKIEGFRECLAERRPDVNLLGTFESNNDPSAVRTMMKAFAAEYPIDALCIQAMDRRGVEDVVSLFPADQKPVICTFGSRAELEELLKSGNLDFAVQEEPFEQGYRAAKTLFNVLQDKDHTADDFVEVEAKIILDECL
ncbi:MAG: LacI family DNA-binding transcriptional regulator [Lawsonibacter sp.]